MTTENIVPIDEYTYDELCSMSYHVQAARWHTEQVLDVLDRLDQEMFVNAYGPLTYIEAEIQRCVQLKNDEQQ